MKIQSKLLTALLAMCAFAAPATAQTTDGYHALQVFPVVVDSTTFVQRFTFDNFNNVDVTVTPRYIPGDGTAQAAVGALTCPSFTIPALAGSVTASLRAMCPALVPGSAFGFLTLQQTGPEILGFAGYSRVSNFAGNGFSVEAFPLNTFSSGRSLVTGLRRLAATGNAPAYQTNCFLANLNELTPSASPIAATLQVSLYQADGSYISGGTVSLPPGRLARYLDIFAAAGAPAGDYNDVTAMFYKVNTTPTDDLDRPGIMSFCTVQDNTSFGADFRIAKLAYGEMGHGANGFDKVRRGWYWKGDATFAQFQVAAGDAGVRLTTFMRHPDFVACRLVDPVSGGPLAPGAGLEMRLRRAGAGNVIAGGNDVTGFAPVFLGDKAEASLGEDWMYLIEVESTDPGTNVAKPFAVNCQTGSGYSSPQWTSVYTGSAF